MATLKDWIDAARPKTLGAAVATVLVVTVIGWRFGGEWHPWLAACTLFSCIALQVATNWFNDAIDFVKGSDTAARLGPRRITASGVVTPKQVLTAACWMLVAATTLSVPLFLARGWPILAIGIPSLYFCYGYTGGPAPLAYRGMGELFVILFFGLVAVTGSAFVQSGQWHIEALVAGLQIGCLSTVLIAINNLRDVEEDTKSNKRTLAVRFGTTFAKWEVTGLVIVGCLMSLYWLPFYQGAVSALIFPAVVIGMFAWQIVRRVWSLPKEKLNTLLATAAKLLLVISATLCLALTMKMRDFFGHS
jgi:1,4-dihydroxy-2-naphthoate octaprenyltransferase